MLEFVVFVYFSLSSWWPSHGAGDPWDGIVVCVSELSRRKVGGRIRMKMVVNEVTFYIWLNQKKKKSTQSGKVQMCSSINSVFKIRITVGTQ